MTYYVRRADRRQIDGAISAFSALEKITASSIVLRAQKEGTFTVLFDSGIRQGSNVVKAIAMGAQGVLGMFITLIRGCNISINDDCSRTTIHVWACGRRGAGR